MVAAALSPRSNPVSSPNTNRSIDPKVLPNPTRTTRLALVSIDWDSWIGRWMGSEARKPSMAVEGVCHRTRDAAESS